MTAPDLTHIADLLLTQALRTKPELTHGGEQWSLSDDAAGGATLWWKDPATDEWTVFTHVSLTVDVKPLPYVVVGGVVYTGEEGVTA